MAHEIPQKQMDQILAYVMGQHSENVRQLLFRNGFSNASELSKDDLNRAFLKAIKDSPTFRADTSQLLTGIVQEGGSFGFVRQPGSLEFAKTGKPKGSKKLNIATEDDWANYYSTYDNSSSTPTATSTSTSTKSGGSFWSSLGGMVNTTNLNALFNTGLSALSTKMASNAQKSSEERALELERIRLQQIQAQTDLAAKGGLSQSTGLSTGAIIGIAVGGVAVLGLIIFLATRKK